MRIHIVGLGPSGPEQIPAGVSDILAKVPKVVVRTRQHPAVAVLDGRDNVVFCDDLYESLESFDAVYDAIVDRVIAAADTGDVVYAVPGSPTVGERSVPGIVAAADRSGHEAIIHPAPSFVDVMTATFGIDPLADGLKVLDGTRLPRPLSFEVPTIIGHVVLPEVLADVLATVDRVVPDGTELAVVEDGGARDERITWGVPSTLSASLAGLRTSVYVPMVSGGINGVVAVMERLREECPWDRIQTHDSLVRYLLEESAELADAIAALEGDDDWVGFAAVEEELGDLLLQVLFHSEIARRAGVFDLGDVAEGLRRKLVRRHPHVFGDVEADDAATVVANWAEIKAAEKGSATDDSVTGRLESIPAALGPLSAAAALGHTAASVGFDWPDTIPVMEDLLGEIRELQDAEGAEQLEHELGDVLWAAVNVARHLAVDPDLALRRANRRFVNRFRSMEQEGPLEGLSIEELDARWVRAKQR